MAALLAAVSLLASTSLAGPSNERVMYGDHKPFTDSGSPTLTPLGAKQLYTQGIAFRDRYVRPKHHDKFVGIVGISHKTIDNSQLHVESSTDECSSAGALAFMQGLYPQFPHVHCDFEVPDFYKYPNNTIENYPLCGYQFDSRSHGHQHCIKHQNLLLDSSNNSALESIRHATEASYSRILSKLPAEIRSQAEGSFHNAYDLYSHAQYCWNHLKETHAEDSGITADDIEELRKLAWREQTLKHAYIPEQDDSEHYLASAVAGRTLVARVASLFAENMKSGGERNKLNLAFTSHEPFLGFSALAGLLNGPSNELFQLPGPGTTLIFELFSIDSDDTETLSNTLDTYDSKNSGSCASSAPSRPYSDKDLHHDTNEGDPRFHEGKIVGRNDRTADVSEGRDIRHNDGETADSDKQDSSGGHDRQSHDSYNYATRPSETSSNYNGKHSRYGNKDHYPSIDQLHVRFLYRDSCDKDSCRPLTPCPLFGSDKASMPFKQFNETIRHLGIANATKWCNVCASDTFFCHGAEPRKKHTHALLALLLGAGGTLLVVAIVLTLVGLLT
ncbi:hypothetical protein N0V88_000445 [Collariella sp. IMI 366227]|nr:hypothetical protein N0V88_000445 [Collariella sp. IMI 366227]